MIELLNPPLYKPQVGHTRLKQGHPLNNGLVGWWLMNEGGGLKAYDLSGKGNHGTITNGPTWTTGKLGPALNFDGTDDYVDLGISTFNSLTNDYTLSAWVIPSIASITANVWSTSGGRTSIGMSSGKAMFHFFSGGDVQVIGTSILPVGKPSLITTVKSSSAGVSVYVNGVLDTIDAAQTSAHQVHTGDHASIGLTYYQGNYYSIFAGSIDDVRICNRVLSAGEIQSLYSDPLAALEPPPIIIWAPSAGVTSYTLTCAPGSFALTGAAATLKFNRALSAESGSFALTGTAATLKFNRLLSAASGAFALTGTAATLTYNPVGSSTLTAASGSFSLAGTATTLKANRILTAASGSFALTGTAASIRANHVLAANSGSIVLTGTAATLTWSGAGSTTLTAADLAAIDALLTAQLPNIAAAVLAAYVEGTTTVQQALRLYDAVLGGKVSGAGTNTETFRDLADTKDRIVATVDSSGNRTAVTRDLS